jgi:alkaline phosphatase D
MNTSHSYLILISIFLISFNSVGQKGIVTSKDSDFTIAFGSCNKQYERNVLWKEIIKNDPKVWIWGGDNVYVDPYNKKRMKKGYEKQISNKQYQLLKKGVDIIGTWDDHDYGKNNAGSDFKNKKESQEMFLDFFDVPKNHPRRTQKGIYHTKTYDTKKGSIKVIVLDTRYFRSATKKVSLRTGQHKANLDREATILGSEQWNWLQNELNNSTSDFNIIVSSIQYLSQKHGFETWGNFPHEVIKLKNTIVDSKAKGVFIISGDRHLSEFSKVKIDGMNYPLIDFTSSGLTHSYLRYKNEPNPFRIKKVISNISFGLLLFDFEEKKVTMQMRGRNNFLQQEYTQSYP